jgi:hypothetical protein
MFLESLYLFRWDIFNGKIRIHGNNESSRNCHLRNGDKDWKLHFMSWEIIKRRHKTFLGGGF